MATIKSSIQLFDNASPALRSMSNALNVVINSFESMQKASNTSIDLSSIKLARDELAKVETNINDIDNQIDVARKQQENFNQSIRNGASATNGLSSGFMKLAATIGTALGINKILETSDEMVSISARLTMIASEGEKVADIQDKIFQSAQRSRGSYADTADAIGKMGIMAKDAFSSTDELVAFMEQINKQFVIAGTEQQGMKAAMLQLTQAMSSGILRGEELNSVFEQAPTIIQAIADYMGQPIGKIRELAKEGLITSEIVKNAMFHSAEETNAKFENMPKTFAQIKQSMANEAQMAFQPVLQKINDLMNDTKFTNFTNRIMGSIVDISNLTITAFDSLINLGNLVAENWDVIAPILGGVTAALIAYKTVAIATSIVQTTLAAATAIKTAADMMASGATFTATAAQTGFNAALFACPITWIVLGVIAFISILIALCNWIAKTTGIAESGFGVIAGAFMAMLAFCGNILIGFVNAVINYLNIFIAPIARIIEWIVNAFNGGFDGIGGALKNLLGQMINLFLDFAKIVTPIIDAVFGTKWTDKLSSLQTDISNWGKNEKAVSWKVELPTIDDRFEYKDAFNFGAELGDKAANKLQIFNQKDETDKLKDELTTFDPNKDSLSNIENYLANTSSNTEKMTDSMEWLDEDIRYLVDVAERESINQFTTAEIKVETTNNNKIDSSLDLDSVLDKFNDGLLEVLQTAAEGVY